MFTHTWMKKILLIGLLAISISSYAKEACEFKSIGLTPESPLPQKLFYTGTCHYRNSEYAAAASAWKKLIGLDAIAPEYSELQVSALNNLGFLLFFGYGINKDQQQAVAYWEKAVSMGHSEAEYHLCHAYADPKESTYVPSRALPHCNKAESFYSKIRNPSKNDRIILSQTRKYKASLSNVIHHPLGW